jgi:hypothetical protein
MALHNDIEWLNAIDIQHTSDYRLCIGMSIIITSVRCLMWRQFDFVFILGKIWLKKWGMELTHCRTNNNELISTLSIVIHSLGFHLQASTCSCIDLCYWLSESLHMRQFGRENWIKFQIQPAISEQMQLKQQHMSMCTCRRAAWRNITWLCVIIVAWHSPGPTLYRHGDCPNGALIYERLDIIAAVKVAIAVYAWKHIILTLSNSCMCLVYLFYQPLW